MFYKLLKEPLLVFLLLGAAMFALFQQVSNDYQPNNAEIMVSKDQIQALELSFEKVWQRSPDAEVLSDKLSLAERPLLAGSCPLYKMVFGFF